jgi:hypothetical protein
LLDGAAHGFERCLANVDAVDGFGVHFGNGPGNGVRANLDVERVALLFREFFRVGQAGQMAASGKNDCGGDDRPKERAIFLVVRKYELEGSHYKLTGILAYSIGCTLVFWNYIC